MLTRAILIPSLVVALFGTVACGSGDEQPSKKPAAAAETDAGANLYSELPAPSSPVPAGTAPALPPLSPDPDGGIAIGEPIEEPGEPLPPGPAPTGTTPAPTPPPPGTVACPAGGEQEVEPNDQATPNVLNGVRCGVVQPGDVEYLQINRQAFQVQWTGAVSVQLLQPTPGGPYLLQVTSQTPSVPTPWQLGYK
jgi:hypothetical protein